MATRLTHSLILAVVLGKGTYAAFCNAFSSGPVASGNYIKIANATLVVPVPPANEAGLLSLWTGMGTSNGDLIQALVESYYGDQDGGCGVEDNNWCAWASALVASGQQGGSQVLTNPGDHVTQSCKCFDMTSLAYFANLIVYIYNDATQQYDQYVLINGDVVSTYSSTSGFAQGWGTAEECNADNCGTVPQHEWINIALVLDQAEPGYSSTFDNNGSEGTLTTADGGLTWTGSKITINACTYSGSS